MRKMMLPFYEDMHKNTYVDVHTFEKKWNRFIFVCTCTVQLIDENIYNKGIPTYRFIYNIASVRMSVFVNKILLLSK